MMSLFGWEVTIGGRMKRGNGTWGRVALMITMAMMLSCSTDISRSSSPVELIATNKQNFFQIDLVGLTTGSALCSGPLGTINVEVRLKDPATGINQQFNDVRITRYRVSYVRTDGGTAVPAPFVLTMDSLVTANGGVQSLSTFIVLQADALTQAPFAALFPTSASGGRDPQTGRSRIDMDVVVEIFGQTLAGTNVEATTRFPLEFCFNCGGCA